MKGWLSDCFNRYRMKAILTVIFALGLLELPAHGQDPNVRISNLESQLIEAKNTLALLQKSIEGLTAEVQSLRKSPSPTAISVEKPETPSSLFKEQILQPGLGGDERDALLSGRPELFIQSRFQAKPLKGVGQQNAPVNFGITRVESRWAGRISNKIGLGFEIQYQPAAAGAAEELVNDAFVEYYANDAVTLRFGQFKKPFGFDVQQSTSVRESPERGMFVGYFIPGERDRGIMLSAKLDHLGGIWHGTRLYAGAFNGNRFFNDSNRQLNYDLRIRKVFDSLPLALGASVQLGRQLLPPGLSGNNREHLYGADLQWSWRRFGARAEFIAGNMPSTLLSLKPDFAPAFRPVAHAAGGSLFNSIRLAGQDQIYWRYDQFNRDFVTGKNIRAFNLGYFHSIGEWSRIGVDYQFKNRESFNDDRLNTKLQLIWNVMYQAKNGN